MEDLSIPLTTPPPRAIQVRLIIHWQNIKVKNGLSYSMLKKLSNKFEWLKRFTLKAKAPQVIAILTANVPIMAAVRPRGNPENNNYVKCKDWAVPICTTTALYPNKLQWVLWCVMSAWAFTPKWALISMSWRIIPRSGPAHRPNSRPLQWVKRVLAPTTIVRIVLRVIMRAATRIVAFRGLRK